MATSAERLAAELADTRRRLIALERASQLAHSTVDVDGEAMPLPDAIGVGVEASKDLVVVRDDLDLAAEELVAQKTRVDEEILPAIEDAAASPVTDARLQAGSLTVWPFQGQAIPAGALAPGAVGSTDIADFSLVARKFNDDRHRIY